VPIAGGTVETMATGQTNPIAVTVDAANVYWSSDADGSISSCPVAKGPVVVLVPASAGARSMGVVLDGPRLLYTRTFDTLSNTGVFSTPLVPGSSTPIVQPQFASPSAITQDAKAIYFTNFYIGGAVMKIAK